MRILMLLSALAFTACATAGAEPERYAGLNCQQLSDLKRSYNQSPSQFDPFTDSDINERSRSGNTSRDNLFDAGQSRSRLTPGEVQYEKELNSIRAASRMKGC